MLVSKKKGKINNKINFDSLEKIPEKSKYNNDNILIITKIKSPIEIVDPFEKSKPSTANKPIQSFKESQNKSLLSSFRVNKFKSSMGVLNEKNFNSIKKSPYERKSPPNKTAKPNKIIHDNTSSKVEKNSETKEILLPAIKSKEESHTEIKLKSSTNNFKQVLKQAQNYATANRSSAQEESVDRYSSIRKSFQEKKLHIFNKIEKLLYVILL